MYWKVNHMVVPKADALKCNDCHGQNGRLDWKALGYAGTRQAQEVGSRRRPTAIASLSAGPDCGRCGFS